MPLASPVAFLNRLRGALDDPPLACALLLAARNQVILKVLSVPKPDLPLNLPCALFGVLSGYLFHARTSSSHAAHLL